jgi:hypothetical protein
MAFPAEAVRLRKVDLSGSRTLTDVFIANFGAPARESATTSLTSDRPYRQR